MAVAALAGEMLVYGTVGLWLLAIVPAAAVTLLKDRWLYFVVGFLTFGITWLIGALSLADPDTSWARTFYGEEKLARAADPGRHRRPHRVTVLWLGGTLALLLAVGLFSARPTPVLGVGGDTLQYSVSGGNMGLSVAPCRRRDHGAWSCSVYDNQFSGTVGYRVKVNGLGCWQATREGFAGEGSEKRLSGCITIWDELRPLDGLFG
jgi:hypothetical protein